MEEYRKSLIITSFFLVLLIPVYLLYSDMIVRLIFTGFILFCFVLSIVTLFVIYCEKINRDKLIEENRRHMRRMDELVETQKRLKSQGYD